MFSMLNVFAESGQTTAQIDELLLMIGIILLLSKVISLGVSKIHLPQVIGFLIAGLLIGLIQFIPGGTGFISDTSAGLSDLAKIGVILIMFSAGIETDTAKIKAVGFASIVITSLGVLVPLLLGFGAAYLFFPNNSVYTNVYYGVILSATSVSITVATLKELHQIDTKVGSAIVSAAIIDDVIGIVLLSLVISLAGGSQQEGADQAVTLNALIIQAMGGENTVNAGVQILIVVLVMVAFFGISVGIGFLIRRLFDWMGKRWPHHIRIPIFSLAFCFLWSYMASLFNIADITGAYIAGLILSATNSKQYIDHRADTTANLLFGPIFFASIAMEMYQAQFDTSNLTFVWFGIAWVVLGALGKIIGAGSGALMCKFKFKDSLKIGVGMMARAEVLIVCAKTGIDAKIVDSKIMPFTIALIIFTSFITPILLKLLYKDELKAEANIGSYTSVKSTDPNKISANSMPSESEPHELTKPTDFNGNPQK
jgi:Kef-type K+ transport system membrane component KefB